MTSISFDSIIKQYGEKTRIGMDAVVASGELFTLLGPSGCGKSTLLRMVAGFVAPTSGTIRFGDRDVTTVPPNKRDAGMVFQNYALFPHMTVAENTAYGLKVRRVSKAEREQRVADALSQVGLSEYGDRRVDQLSGGQQQRVALARAVVISPSVLLLDEPLSNLDAKLREETRGQIRRVQTESGITALYVTHDQAEAMAMSDRIAVLDAGRVHQIASPDTIYHRPRTEFVARFIGRSNVMPATVTAVGDATVDVTVGEVAVTAPRPDIDVTVGDSVGLSLRPETLGFVADGEGLFRGEVTESEFSGATSTFTVEVGESTMLVTVPATGTRPDVGDRVSVGLVSGGAWVVER